MTDEYTTDDVCKILNVGRDSLQACLRAALFQTSARQRSRRFSFHDLLLLKTAKGLCEAGIPVGRIRRVLQSLREQLPSDQRLSTVKIYADGHRVVVWDGHGRWQPDSGQFLLNFDAHTVAPTRALPRKDHTRRRREAGLTAVEWLDRGVQLQADSPEEARHAYEEALARDPSLVEAYINLGLLHHKAGRFDAAELYYQEAIARDPGVSLAYFNLGVVHEDRGDLPGAIAAYREAVAREPTLKDAHQHLARLYEAEGRRADAIRHYAAAKALDRPPGKKRR